MHLISFVLHCLQRHMWFKGKHHTFEKLLVKFKARFVLMTDLAAGSVIRVAVYPLDTQRANEETVSCALADTSPLPAPSTLAYCSDMKVMGKLLSQNILFIFGAFLIGYLATISIAVNTEHMMVFRQVFIASFMPCGWAQIPIAF
jgi:hypothetical protein